MDAVAKIDRGSSTLFHSGNFRALAILGNVFASTNSKLQDIEVQCERDAMKVTIKFNTPFNGIVFSKGFYSDLTCVHVKPNSGANSATFVIAKGACGIATSGNPENYGQPNPAGSFVQNTIIIQYDPQVQEVWDQARRLKCTWYDFYEKSVTFKPFTVNRLNAVTANFLGDSLQCWMQIQSGKGPWAGEVSGIVKIGQTMTMVLGIKDEEEKFDMLVRNCVAHDGKRSPIQLVDDQGCIQRPKIMSTFQKIKHFGSSASVVSYAYFQAFKFPDSMNVHFQCVIQVCRFSCPPPQCGNDGSTSGPAQPGQSDVNPIQNVNQQATYATGPQELPIGVGSRYSPPQRRFKRSPPNKQMEVTVQSDMGVLDVKDLVNVAPPISNASFVAFDGFKDNIICATVSNHHGLTFLFLTSTFAVSVFVAISNGSPCSPQPMRSRAHAVQSPCGPEPMRSRAHVVQSPCGPEPMRSRAHAVQSPSGPMTMRSRAHAVQSPCGPEPMRSRAHAVQSPCGPEPMRSRAHAVQSPCGPEPIRSNDHVVQSPCGPEPMRSRAHAVQSPCGPEPMRSRAHPVQ
eukprot:snap_masked-scaffold33_size549341-processed-gene-1.0 protein:Tk11531 transcript:snap_masked-scaffold33_size549341-processed-gene-1.0-mRNA-1 annotation:"PREDICTED: uncharacterized protein LOC103314772"